MADELALPFLPTSCGSFRGTTCICKGDICRQLRERFKKMNDARGGFFNIPAMEGGQEEQQLVVPKGGIMETLLAATAGVEAAEGRPAAASPPPSGAAAAASSSSAPQPPPLQGAEGTRRTKRTSATETATARKRTMIETLIGGGPVPSGRCFVAMLHFPPSILKSKCMRRRGNKHTYCWSLERRITDNNNKVTELVAPFYNLEDVQRDAEEMERVSKERPPYAVTLKESTEEVVALLLRDRTKITQTEQKKMKEFVKAIKRQLGNGKMLPLEKEARLEQIGFFQEFPRPEVVVNDVAKAVVGQEDSIQGIAGTGTPTHKGTS